MKQTRYIGDESLFIDKSAIGAAHISE